MNKVPKVYLDNAASTEISEDVVSDITERFIKNIYGNPSSQHLFGSKLNRSIILAHRAVGKSLGCLPEEIVFTSGGTEANNLALRGVYKVYSDRNNGIVFSAGEHSSVRKTIENIATEDNIRIIPLLSNGELDFEWAERLITEDTFLVSIMLINNITGNIYNIKKIVELAHSKGALVHCDAVQAYGKIPIDVKNLEVDLLSISGHKVHALPGTGALYVRKGVMIDPIITGGSQESGFRAGTENYLGIISLAISAGDISDNKYVSPGLRDAFEIGVKKRIPHIVINGELSERSPHISSITFKEVNAQVLATLLEEKGILVSTGSACSSRFQEPSKTLLSMGLSERDALSTIRFSFSRFSTIADTMLAIEATVQCVNSIRKGTT